MKYNGKELIEYKTTESIIFNPPKKMLVWDNNNGDCLEADVVAVLPNRNYSVVALRNTWMHCAEIPKQKPATHRELARWLAEGKGEMRRGNLSMVFTSLSFDNALANDPIDEFTLVRKWDDTEWVSPTREYLGLGDK